MAMQAAEVRSDRLVVLLSKAEKATLLKRAKSADMTLSEYVRTAADRYDEPTKAERALMADLLRTLEEANARTDAALERLQTVQERAAAFDEDAYRRKVEQRLRADDDLDWAGMAAELGLTGA